MITEDLVYKLVGTSSAIKTVESLIQQVANRSTTALILGESGSGKELIARIIHQYSKRSSGPFVAVNCAAIPLELLESELFGHEKGAFTGAIVSRLGRFELAAGGTLFLDEIGDLPISMQAKLLRVLQERSFERVGGNKPIKVDVRILAATHKNLEDCLEEGSFREDLYYRLNVFPIAIPPLRKRREDIPLLIQHFIEEHKKDTDTIIQLLPETLNYLENYNWPGNVRELANLIERLFILFANKSVEVEDLPEQLLKPGSRRNDKNLTIMTTPEIPTGSHFDLKKYLTSLELNLITQALNDCAGVVAHAAKRLGLRRTTLVEKMKKHGIGREINFKAQQSELDGKDAVGC